MHDKITVYGYLCVIISGWFASPPTSEVSINLARMSVAIYIQDHSHAWVALHALRLPRPFDRFCVQL